MPATIDWSQVSAAFAVGAGLAYGVVKLRPEGVKAAAQTEAIAVDTLRDVVLELRNELERVRGRLLQAEDLIEQLTGERMPGNGHPGDPLAAT